MRPPKPLGRNAGAVGMGERVVVSLLVYIHSAVQEWPAWGSWAPCSRGPPRPASLMLLAQGLHPRGRNKPLRSTEPVLPRHPLIWLLFTPNLTLILGEYMQLALKVVWPWIAHPLENCASHCPLLHSTRV